MRTNFHLQEYRDTTKSFPEQKLLSFFQPLKSGGNFASLKCRWLILTAIRMS